MSLFSAKGGCGDLECEDCAQEWGRPVTTTRTGVLHLYSETGTEGGWWSFQDAEFIVPAPDEASDKTCDLCGSFWGNYKTTDEPPPEFYYYDEDSGYVQFQEEPVEEGVRVAKVPGSLDDRYNLRHNEEAKECYDNGHTWKDFGPFDAWSYEGLITLRNGDVLDVFDADGKEIVQTITVNLISNYDQYAPGAKHARGMVIHYYPDPETIDFEEWNDYFFGERKCILHRTERKS